MSLSAIGQKLKSARDAQGLSLIQVYERTKIPVNHLQAVENGDTEELPEPVFIFGFIKRYAECVGLDGQILADEYKSFLDDSNGKPTKNKNESTPYYTSSEYISRSKISVSTPTYKLWLFNSIIIVGVIGTITWFINAQSNNIANQTDPSLQSLKYSTSRLSPVAPLPNTNNGNLSNTDQTNPANLSSEPNKIQKVTLSANKHVWVEVKRMSDGESIFTGFLEQGDRRDFEDPQGLFIRSGDGGSLSVENQGKIESFGLPGKITERTFALPTQEGDSQLTSGQGNSGSSTSSSTSNNGSLAATRPQKRIFRRSTAYAEGGSRPTRDREVRHYDSQRTDTPARYSEGRLDSD